MNKNSFLAILIYFLIVNLLLTACVTGLATPTDLNAKPIITLTARPSETPQAKEIVTVLTAVPTVRSITSTPFAPIETSTPTHDWMSALPEGTKIDSTGENITINQLGWLETLGVDNSQYMTVIDQTHKIIKAYRPGLNIDDPKALILQATFDPNQHMWKYSFDLHSAVEIADSICLPSGIKLTLGDLVTLSDFNQFEDYIAPAATKFYKDFDSNGNAWVITIDQKKSCLGETTTKNDLLFMSTDGPVEIPLISAGQYEVLNYKPYVGVTPLFASIKNKVIQ